MQPLFETDTTNTFEAYKEFSWMVAHKLHHYTLYNLALVAIWLVAVIRFFYVGHLLFGGIALLIALAIPVVRVLSMNHLIKKEWKSNKALQNVTKHYAFFEDHVILSDENGVVKYEYDKLYRILEGEDAFYLLTGGNAGLIVEKEGCSEELCAFIRRIETDE